MRWETRVEAHIAGRWVPKGERIHDDRDPGAFAPFDAEDAWHLWIARWHREDPTPARYRLACWRQDDNGETLVDSIEIDPGDYPV